MAELQFPDIVGNYNQGFDRGQQQQFNSLAGQAIADPTNTNALNQAAQINPMAAQRIQLVQQAQQQQAAQAQQAQQVDHAAKINGAANYMLQAIQTKDPAQIEGAYQTVRPYLAELGQAQGKVPPANYDPSMAPTIYQLAGQSGGIPQAQGTVISPGGVLVDKATGKQMFSNPANGQFQSVPTGQVDANGNPITQAGLVNPQSAQFTPLQAGGQNPSPQQGANPAFQTTITPSSPANTGAAAQANALLAKGATPEQAMQQIVASNPQMQFGLKLDPTSGQFVDDLPAAQAGAAPAQAGAATSPSNGLGFGQSVKASPKDKPPSGYRLAADGQSLEPIPGGPADKGGSSNVTLGDPTKTGDDYLQTVPDAGMQGLIKAIAEGRMQIPKIYRAGKAGEIGPTQIAQAVAQYDPTYDQGDPASRLKSRNDFTSGASAKQLQQLNTLLGHLGGLADAADKLHNSSVPLYNTMANAVESGTGNQAVTNFNSARDPAAEEFAALLKGGVPAEGEIQAAKANLSANNSPAQLRGSIGTMAAQVQSRIAALQQRAATGLGPFANKVPIITPEGQAALDKLRNAGYIGKFDLGEQGTQGTPSAQATQRDQPRAVNSMGHAVVWNGSAWVPE